jgi:hypothetical protein
VSDFLIAVLAASGVLFFALGTYVLARNPFQRASRTFFLLTAGLGISCYLQMLIGRAWDGSVALLAMHCYVFALLLSFSALFLLSRDLTVSKGRAGGSNRPAVLIGLVSLAAIISLAVDGVDPINPGFAVRWGPGTAAFVLTGTALAGLSALGMIRGREASTDRDFRSQSLVLAFGGMLPLAAMGSSLLGNAGEAGEALAAISYLAAGASLVYLATAYTLFQLPTVRGPEQVSGRTMPIPARFGSTILFKGKGSEAAFDALVREQSLGEKGLIITRLHPDQVRERYPVEHARILWLCGQPGEGRVDPLGLTILQNIIIEHMQRQGRSLILLDGIEYLVSENHIEKVLRLLYDVRDSVIISGSKLLVPLDPKTLSVKELALIEREFRTLVDTP